MKQQESISIAVAEQFRQQVGFLQRLVQAKSANPFTPDTSPPDAPIEEEVAAVIQGELQRLGFEANLYGVSSQRPNVLCHIRGAGRSERTLILTIHMDTVEPSDYTRDPWSAQMEGGRLYGVGVADAKAQISAFIYAISALQKAGMVAKGNVLLAFVVDEESGACSPYGTHYLLEQGLLYGDAAIVGEPGDDKIAIGHRGLYRFRIQTHGEATHTGMKAWEQGTRGHNAILDMTDIIRVLSTLTLPQMSSLAFPNRRSVFTFPTLIQGGSGINIVPVFCEAYGDVRLLPGLSGEEVRKMIEAKLKELPCQTYRLDDVISVPAVEISPKSAVVQSLAEAAKAVTGVRPHIGGSGPACDGWMFITRDIPAICGYGAEYGGVHGPDEWVDLESLHKVTEVYAHTIIRYFERDL
jgi:succinyl-diaminopimelate desuccinylase